MQNRRLSWLLDSSIQAFGRYGYQRCQIADIAREARLAPGTVYRYAESKHALFAAAVRRGFGEGSPGDATALPLPDPESGETLAFLRDTLLALRERLSLPNVLERADAQTIAQELEAVVGALYDVLASNKGGIRIVDRSAREWPELAQLFFSELRSPGIAELEGFLKSRSASGLLAPIAHVPATARQILEMCSWMAIHRRWTPDEDDIRHEEARASVLQFTLRALLPESGAQR